MDKEQRRINKLLQKASDCEEHFRRFDPRREIYSGGQRRNLITAYTKMNRAKKKLDTFIKSIETKESARQM